MFAIKDVFMTVNIVNSHTVYKIKHEDDGKLKLKARNGPHGNEYDLKEELAKYCSICPPTVK